MEVDMPLNEQLLEFMKEKAYKPMTEGELISALNIHKVKWTCFSKHFIIWKRTAW